MIIKRQKTFSLEQREFNSKAAKALNDKHLRMIAKKYEPNLYKSWHETAAKQEARLIRREAAYDNDNINTLINGKPGHEEASYRRSVSPDIHFGFAENWRNKLKPTNREQQKIYDHGLGGNRLIKGGDSIGYGCVSISSPKDLRWRLDKIRKERLKKKINKSAKIK